MLNTAALWHEETEGWARSWHEPSSSSFCSSMLSLPYKSSIKRGGWPDYVWLIWGQLLVSLENQMKEEERLSKRCEYHCSLEGWEGSGWRTLKVFLAESQREPGGDNLPHICSVWLVVGLLSGCSASGNASCNALPLHNCACCRCWKLHSAVVATFCFLTVFNTPCQGDQCMRVLPFKESETLIHNYGIRRQSFQNKINLKWV